MLQWSKYHKGRVAIFILFVLTLKYLKCERKTFILPYKREYGLQLHFEYSYNCFKSDKPQWRMGQNIAKKYLIVFDLNGANRKKCWKCDSNTLILPHKREYSLLPHLEHSRNCWKSTSHNDEWVKISQRTSESLLF